LTQIIRIRWSYKNAQNFPTSMADLSCRGPSKTNRVMFWDSVQYSRALYSTNLAMWKWRLARMNKVRLKVHFTLDS